MKTIDNYDLIIINILFFIFPFTAILGNLYTNLNIILLCICALFFYGKKIIKIKLNFFDKILLVFFFLHAVGVDYKFFRKSLYWNTLSKIYYL